MFLPKSTSAAAPPTVDGNARRCCQRPARITSYSMQQIALLKSLCASSVRSVSLW